MGFLENIFYNAYSYISSLLWQIANLLGISIEILLYSVVASIVIGIFLLKRNTSPQPSLVPQQQMSENSELDYICNPYSWDHQNPYRFNPLYSYLPQNIYHDNNN